MIKALATKQANMCHTHVLKPIFQHINRSTNHSVNTSKAFIHCVPGKEAFLQKGSFLLKALFRACHCSTQDVCMHQPVIRWKMEPLTSGHLGSAAVYHIPNGLVVVILDQAPILVFYILRNVACCLVEDHSNHWSWVLYSYPWESSFFIWPWLP